jgi:hypothetical protein
VRLRSKLAERARPYLQPGEQIQAVFKAQSRVAPYWGWLPLATIFILLAWADLSRPGLATAIAFYVVLASGLWSVFYLVSIRSHLVVVTDRAIVVLDVSTWSPSGPARLRLRHPRNFHFGRRPGFRGQFVLDNAKYWVPMLFRKDVAAANAALTE